MNNKKKLLLLVLGVLICSISILYLSNFGNINPMQSEGTISLSSNEIKENQTEALPQEQELLNDAEGIGEKDELLLNDFEINAMAQEYQVSEKEVRENIDYYQYQWQLDHPEKVNAASEVTITRTYKYNGHELAIYDDSEVENLHGKTGLKKLSSWISSNFNWKKGAATNADGVLKTGYGDCWGLTDLAKHILLNNGYSIRVIELKTSESDHHRALEVLLENGKWTRFDPSMITEAYNKKPYYYKVGDIREVLEVYQ